MTRIGLGLGFIGFGVLTATAAIAQGADVTGGTAEVGQSGQALEEIIVTARRKQENLQKVPVAVTAISADTLESSGASNLMDLQSLAPGLESTASSRGETNPGFAIRGQRGGVTITSLYDPAVGIYFADFNWLRTTGTNQSMYDLQSVQVLKGPQGTLFGRNATGGAILLEPNPPSDKLGGYIQGRYGSYNLGGLQGVLNVPVSDKLAVRVAGDYSKRDGYLKNVSTGQRENDVDDKSIRASVAYRPTDDINSTVIGSYFEGSGAGAGYKLVFQDPKALNPALGALGPLLVNAIATDLAKSRALGKYQTLGSMPQNNDNRAWTVQDKTEMHLGKLGFLGDVTLKNILGYRQVSGTYNLDFTGTSFPLFTYKNGVIENQSYSEEFQIQGETPTFDYIVGAYYFHEHGMDAFVNEQLGILAARVPAAFPSDLRTDDMVKNSSTAIYAHGDYKLSSLLDGLSLSGGARVTWDERDVNWHQINSRGVAPAAFSCALTGAILTAPSQDLCSTNGHASFSQPSYDVSANYQVDPDVLIYLSHRRGYRSGGFNAVPPANTTYDSFGPEIVRDVELGLKSDIVAGAVPMRLNLALYHQWREDAQVSIAIPQSSTAVATGIVNGPREIINGVEGEWTARLFQRLLLDGSVSFLHETATNFFDYQVIGGVVTPVNVSDSPLQPYIPDTQWNFSMRYDLPVPAAYGDLSLHLAAYGQTSMQSGIPATSNCGPLGTYFPCYNREGELAGYWLLNFRAEWKNVANRGVDLALFVNNLTDKYYEDFGFNLMGFGLTSNSVSIGAPRMFGVEVRVPFGAQAQAQRQD